MFMKRAAILHLAVLFTIVIGSPIVTADCPIPRNIYVIKVYDSHIVGDQAAKQTEGTAQLLAAEGYFHGAINDIYNPALTAEGYTTFSYAALPNLVRLIDVHDIDTSTDAATRALMAVRSLDGRIVWTQFIWDAFVPLLTATYSSPFGIPKTADNMPIFVVDEIANAQTSGEDQGISLMNRGFLFIASGKLLVTPDKMIDVYAHEIGHLLGLGHFYETVDTSNVMYDTAVLNVSQRTLQLNQTRTLIGHVCGTPADVLTLKGQSGTFAVNEFVAPIGMESTICGDGKVGKGEQCEESFFRVRQVCPDDLSRPVPTYPHRDSLVCSDACQCVTSSSGPVIDPPKTRRDTIPPTGGPGGGGSGPTTGGPEAGGGGIPPQTGSCFMVPGAQCQTNADCPSRQYCDTESCTCSGYECPGMYCRSSSDCPLYECGAHGACVDGCCRLPQCE
jgi:hypothetical protein